MLTIQTSGSWRQMGRQLGQRFGELLHRCVHHYCPRLIEDRAALSKAVAPLCDEVGRVCPAILDETIGLAESAGLELDLLLAYRFSPVVRERMRVGCTVVLAADREHGPLLGRNCDLSPEFDPEVQLCRVARPNDGPAVICTTYLGMIGVAGVNALGLGIGGASAHTTARGNDRTPGTPGTPPGSVIQFMALHGCGDVAAARALFESHAFDGKPHISLIADAGGASMLAEFVPGLPAHCRARQDSEFQYCTNFFSSGRFPVLPRPAYLQSAFARYGRIGHAIATGELQPTVSSLKALLTEVAQPGAVDDGMGGKVKTAYSQIMELKTGRMHYTPGHPAETAWQAVSVAPSDQPCNATPCSSASPLPSTP